MSAVMAAVEEERLEAGHLVLESEPKPEPKEKRLQREAGGVSHGILGPYPAAFRPVRVPNGLAPQARSGGLPVSPWVVRAAQGEDVDEQTAQVE